MSRTGELIGDSLKKYRKQAGLSVVQVSAIMEQKYDIKVAAKTIYGWESNQCCPPTPKMLALCEIYQIKDINASFTELPPESRPFVITPRERQLVLAYRSHPDLQDAVRRMLDVADVQPAATKK